MTHSIQTFHHAIAAVAAVVMTVALQGSLLVGLDQMTDDSSASTTSSHAATITLPTVTVTYARG